MKIVHIAGKCVGDGHPVYVIAEVGINHNGSVSLAKEMLEAAWESGADAVKIQTFITKDFLHESHPGYQYDIDAEIPHDQEQEIWDFARARGILLFSTPEEFKSLGFIVRQQPALIKIAAMDFNYKPLVQKAASLKIPILLSSGMSTLEEVLQTSRWVEEAGNVDYIPLHCVSCYPAKPEDCNLHAIQTMKSIMQRPVGFSDHTEGIHVPLAAVALGANLIEKHFTISKSLPGPDQRCSMDPTDLRNLVDFSREIVSAMGDGRKCPAPSEAAPRVFKRRGVYAARDLPEGTVLRESDVLFLAPSSEGSSVADWSLMEGRALRRGVASNSAIALRDLD